MDLKKRFKDFAVAELIQVLQKNTINIAYSNQLIRSSSSPATNYRASLRGKSTAYFINKLKGISKNSNSTVRLSLSKSFYIAQKPTSRFRQAANDRVFRDALKIVEEEVDEPIYFLELLLHFNPTQSDKITSFIKEGNELLAITVASLETARTNAASSCTS
jgi:hypothetical protein